mmetsp:Transcript_4659/g.6057  ORF Transcript_4659/g.6057 Transcript_4659/m.6057 type:complete len:136 (+) Transcript_4659:136-543(+)
MQGPTKWETDKKLHEDLIKNTRWKGNTQLTLQKFLEMHRTSRIHLQACSEHITCEVPSQYSRSVGYILENIQSTDPALEAAKAAITQDNIGPNAKRNNFENAVAFLMPRCPVTAANNKKRKSVSFETVLSIVYQR